MILHELKIRIYIIIVSDRTGTYLLKAITSVDAGKPWIMGQMSWSKRLLKNDPKRPKNKPEVVRVSTSFEIC